MKRKEIILDIEEKLITEDKIEINKEEAKEIIKLLKAYDSLFKSIKEASCFKEDMLKELKYKLEVISETKFNHLLLADDSEYHNHRYIVEKEKCDLLEDLIKFMYNLN